MKTIIKTSTTFYLLLTTLLASHPIFGQEFGNIENIEKLFTLTSKQVDSTLLKKGYHFKSKEIKENIITYEKLVNNNYILTVNVSFRRDKLYFFSWDDFIDQSINMVGSMRENYKINEYKTNDSLGIFYLESKTLELDVIIFKTQPNIQVGKIAFNISRRVKPKPLKKKR